MNRKQEILRRLSERDGFISGQELCEMLGVSRTAVWKNINKLKEEGYPIEAVTNKGYRLLSVEEADILDREQISARLTTQWAGRPLIYKEETGSTNDDIFVLAAEGYPHGTLVVASRQSAGKGRRGRTWLSPKDGNVYMSILLKPDLPPEVTPMLTVVMALSVYQASLDIAAAMPEETRARCRFGIKWPNDIVVSVDGGPYRKLCFRLFRYSLLTFDRFFCLVLFHMLHVLGGLIVNKGRAVHVLDPRAPFTGTAVGIDMKGELLVQPDDGSAVRTIASGEVSVRGVKGYI